MTDATTQYSSLFACRYDQPYKNNRQGYSVFRAIDSRDVEQKLTVLPHVHDFAVLWDDDNDTRIIPVLEEMLMSGLLPGVQFIGEHKGTLTVILAARTYWKIDVEAYAVRLNKLTGDAAGDYWNVLVGSYDHGKGNLRLGHQCDFQEIIGGPDEFTHAYLYAIDTEWQLGTKAWISADLPGPSVFAPLSRYAMRRRQAGVAER
jgi:hypothetical protein